MMLLNYKKKKQWLAILLLALLPVMLPWIAITAFRIYLYGNKNSVKKADAVIVLGAEIWGDKPSPVFRERINHAINLYKHGDVRQIIFTGGIGKNKEIAEAIVGKWYAMTHGVEKSDILIETESLTTLQNLKNANKVASSLSHQLSYVSDC